MERAELAAFSRKLNDLMARAGMSQSDLARALWGTMVDARGRDVARNQDRISHYTRGTQMPEPKTLKALAGVFSVPVTDLVPSLMSHEGKGAPAEISFTLLAGGSDMALLTVNKMLPLALATQVLALLAQADAMHP